VGIAKINVSWTGWNGGPGLSTFFALNQQPGDTIALAPLRDFFFAAVTGHLPSIVSIAFPVAGDVLDETTGLVLGGWSATPVSPVTGVGATNFSATSGAVITWRTLTIVNGKRIRGRTFLVPLLASAYAPDGTLDTNFRGNVLAAGAALIAQSVTTFGIYHRPVSGAGGKIAQIAAATMTDRAMVLRSRRQ
jgi:hypothetical protein